jgi:hypothetical protein
MILNFSSSIGKIMKLKKIVILISKSIKGDSVVLKLYNGTAKFYYNISRL